MEDRLRRYEKIEFLGEGQFATVYKARDTQSDNIVAVKKIKIGSRADAKDGIHRTALREIKLLQELHHINIIGLLDVFGHMSNVSLVFDFMDYDMEVVIKDTSIVLSPANIKSYMLQTLQGLEYLHNNWILHRDLKPNNLLVNSEGILKIGDFGLAKFFGSPNRVYTHQVVTRWYRAPELLFGARMYGTSVDIWALGCILAELLLRVPFLPGESDLDQLTRIFSVMGTPTEETWPGLTLLQDYIQFKPMPSQPLRHIFSAAGDDLLHLISSLLTVNPLGRCTCEQALQMDYFSSKPAPTPGPQLPLPSTINRKQEDRPSLKRKLLDAVDGGVSAFQSKVAAPRLPSATVASQADHPLHTTAQHFPWVVGGTSCTLDQLDRQSSSPNLIELGEPRISAAPQREVPPNQRNRSTISDSPQHNGGSISPASTSGASMPLRDSPGASSTASDSPTPKNNIQDSHWHGLEERCQLLGTEEESSDRHSSASDTDQDDAAWSPWIITTEQRDYYCAQFRALQPDVNGLLSGPEARCFFEKSRLSLPELRKIWQLADVTKDGALSLEEFKTAMHLVVLRRNNIDLPDKLPPSLIPSIPPLAPVPPPPSKPTTGEKHKPASEESLALSNVSPPQADLTSPQKGKDVSKWTKFMDSPTSSVSSPGPKPVNFDFHKSAVEQDPKILHPVPLRLTPESQNLTASGDDSVDPCRSPRRLTADSVHDYDSMAAPPDIRPIQRPQPKKPAAPGPGAIPPPPPSQAAVMSSSDGPASISNSSGFSISGPTSLPMGLKKEPPPPPPPRPHRTHARSSSLDLNRLDASSGKNIALLGAPPMVPPRISPSTTSSRKLMVQHSEGADPLHQGFADFTQFENQLDFDAVPRRHGAFEVYRKPTPKNTVVAHENIDVVEDVLKGKLRRTVIGDKMSFQQLQEKNTALVRTCHLLSLELAEVQTEKAELEIQLERLRASLPR